MKELQKTIEVYDKNKEKRIAVFSNQNMADSVESQIDLMVAPTVHIVSNGESTLSFQMLSNSEKWNKIKNPENIYVCGGREYTALNEKSIVENGDVVNVTLVETWYLLNRKFVQVYNVKSESEFFDEHTVKILPKTNESELEELMKHDGNVDLVHRKKVYIDESNIDIVRTWFGMEEPAIGDFMTVASQTYTDEENGTAIAVTPILPNGDLLTQSELDNHFDKIIEDSYYDKKYALHDNKNVIMGVFSGGTEQQNIEKANSFCIRVHDLHAMNFNIFINGKEYKESEVKDSKGNLMPRGSAGYALWCLLHDTDWKLGVCDVLPEGFSAKDDYGTFNVESDMKDVLYNIQFVQQLYGGILVWDSKNKTLSLRDERKYSDFNKWKSYSIRKNKNLGEKPKITWDNKIITRLYPLGNGNLNIKAANNGKTYIENFSYTDRVYEGYIQNQNIYYTGGKDTGGQKTLKFWAERKLEELCKPRKTIEYSIIDMRATEEYRHEQFDINDIVKAYYDEDGKEKSEFVRIQEISYDYFHPSSDSNVKVGDKIDNEVEIFYQVYKKSQNQAPTDFMGNISGYDVYVEIPEFYLEDFGYGAGGFGYGSLAELTRLHAYYEEENENKIIQAESAVEVVANELSAQVNSFTSFKKETENNFQESYTQINQISTALSAQINLEASHYSQLKGNVDDVTQSLASFQLYAGQNYATISSLASYATTDSVNQKISSSEASIKQYARNNFASITLSATVSTVDERTNQINTTGSVCTINSGFASMFIPNTCGLTVSPQQVSLTAANSATVLLSTAGRVSISGGSLDILGKNVYWDSKKYLRAR